MLLTDLTDDELEAWDAYMVALARDSVDGSQIEGQAELSDCFIEERRKRQQKPAEPPATTEPLPCPACGSANIMHGASAIHCGNWMCQMEGPIGGVKTWNAMPRR